MKEFIKDNGPYIKDNNNTSKMMKHLFIALLPIIIFSYIKNGLLPFLDNNIDFITSLKPLLIILVAAFTCLIIEILWSKFILKKNVKSYLEKSYAIFPGLFLGLILPLNTPYYVVILGALFATVFGKLLFGGFGHNIFNPALVGRLFVVISYYTVITNSGGYLNGSELDAIAGATPLGNASSNWIGNYDLLVKPFGNLWDFFFGYIPGSIGETSALFCLLGLIYLLIKKVIKWRIPIIYITTVFIITSIIGFSNNLGIWYPLFHILSGGLMFGAIFMATDPVTSPTTPIGQVIYALGLGILTVIFRFLSIYPEGVLTSILTMNFLVIIIDKIGSHSRFNIKKVVMIFSVLILIIGGITFYITNNVDKDKDIKDSSFKIENIKEDGSTTIYSVVYKGYHGNMTADIKIINKEVIDIVITRQNEAVWGLIESNNYLEKIIQNQNNLQELDAISGATITANYLKEMVQYTLEYIGDNNEE